LLLSRADRLAVSDIVEHEFICDHLLAETNQEHRWPLAAWRLCQENLQLANQDSTAASEGWLCADPVYIHPDRTEALLLAHEELELQLEEAQALAQLINQHYQDEPWQLHVASTHRWYIQTDRDYDITTRSLARVKGLNIFEHLPSGEDSRYWQQCMNEIQMLLHASDINMQREAQGQLPVNSLWLWGHGRTVSPGGFPWRHVYSNDAVVTGLALGSGSEVHAMPESANQIDNQHDKVFIYMDTLQRLLQQQDIHGWLAELQSVEDNWFKPLMQSVRNQQLELTLLFDDQQAYRLGARQLRRWWRRRKSNQLLS
jgi:hypothetical protein